MIQVSPWLFVGILSVLLAFIFWCGRLSAKLRQKQVPVDDDFPDLCDVDYTLEGTHLACIGWLHPHCGSGYCVEHCLVKCQGKCVPPAMRSA